MNGKKVKQCKRTDPGIIAQCLGPHVSGHHPRQKNEQKGGYQEKSAAMASVEMMALAKHPARV
jgi:hypothetical protein